MDNFNKRGQIGQTGIAILFLFIGILVGSLLTYTTTGNVVKDIKDYVISTKEAEYTLLDEGPFTGETFLSSSAKFEAELRNEESQAAYFDIVWSCSTNEKSSTQVNQKLWVQPNTIQEFEFEYNSGRSKEWRCVLNHVESGKIDTCISV